jgi:hypothetical protein
MPPIPNNAINAISAGFDARQSGRRGAGIKFSLIPTKASMRILIPVDGSHLSKAAVAFMASRDTLIQTQPEVELLNIQYAVSSRVVRAAGSELVNDCQASEASKVLKPCVASLKRAV